LLKIVNDSGTNRQALKLHSDIKVTGRQLVESLAKFSVHRSIGPSAIFRRLFAECCRLMKNVIHFSPPNDRNWSISDHALARNH